MSGFIYSVDIVDRSFDGWVLMSVAVHCKHSFSPILIDGRQVQHSIAKSSTNPFEWKRKYEKNALKWIRNEFRWIEHNSIRKRPITNYVINQFDCLITNYKIN